VNGLESILNWILDEAKSRVDDLDARSKIRCAEIISLAEDEASRILAEAKDQAGIQAKVLLQRAESMASLDARKTVLTARQAIIDEAISQAASRLSQLPVEEKIDLYRRLISSNASGNETIIFASRDLPIAGQILDSLNHEKNWQLILESEPGNFTAGIILNQDYVQTNLTFDLLIRDLRPDLVRLAAQILFGERLS
jgi:V/A-type H+/Na+-transporting ATPase subunit E